MRDMLQRKPQAPRVSAKVKTALKAIVWDGQELAEAAATADLTTQALRQALARPHVIQEWKKERDVFIAYARAGNPHDLLDIRRNSKNDNARVAAAKVIEAITDDRINGTAPAVPGIVIVIGNVEKPLNQAANVLELQAKALPCEGDTGRDGA